MTYDMEIFRIVAALCVSLYVLVCLYVSLTVCTYFVCVCAYVSVLLYVRM